MAVGRRRGTDRAAGVALGTTIAREIEALEAALAQDWSGAGETGTNAREAVGPAEIEAEAAG